MLGAIYIGLSGMDAYEKGLQTISNNVANLNTAGFKSTSVSFNDLFSYGGGGSSLSNSSAGNPAGSGVAFGNPLTDFSQGDLRASDNDLDLAIQGGGFLVLLDGDKTYYARTGQFVVDKDGYISEQGTGYQLAVLDADGRPSAVQLDSKRTNPPEATTTITFNGNIAKDTDASAAAIAVYDDEGTKHVWTVKLTRDTTEGVVDTWNVSVTDDKGLAVISTTHPNTQLKITRDKVDPTTSKFIFVSHPSGAGALNVTLDFSGDITTFTSGASTLNAKPDGNAVGSLAAASPVTIDADGHIKLNYTNGEFDTLGAVAIADFRDPQQLERIGNGLFKNLGAGTPRLLGSGVDGIGTLQSKKQEASNVDLSQEFGQLILIQRGFQASSQVVSVSNDMIQQLFGIRGQG